MLIRAMSEADVNKNWEKCDMRTNLQVHKCSRWKIVEHGAESSQAACGMCLGAQWPPVSSCVNQNIFPCSPVKEHLYG